MSEPKTVYCICGPGHIQITIRGAGNVQIGSSACVKTTNGK